MIIKFEESLHANINNLHSKLLDVINEFARDQQTMPIAHVAASIQAALVLAICKLHSAASASEKDFYEINKLACDKIMKYQYQHKTNDE